MNKIRVDDLMTHFVVTLRPEDTIEDAARMLGQNGIRGAPVVQERKLVGLVSEADLLRAFAPPRGSTDVGISALAFLLRGTPPRSVHSAPVRDVMSEDVVSISLDASVWEAASLLDRHGLRRLPVIDGEGYLIGILTRSDLVRAMARTDPDLITSVTEAIGLLGMENFSDLDVTSQSGCVKVGGIADRRSTRDHAINIASRVPGVLEISDELQWHWDDTALTPVCSRTDPNLLESDPCAVGPLVKVAG